MIVFSPEQEQFLQRSQARAYFQGKRDGLELYAHWKDGVQYVGTIGRTLQAAIEEINQAEADTLRRYTVLTQI